MSSIAPVERVGAYDQAHWADILTGNRADLDGDFPAVVKHRNTGEEKLVIVKLMDHLERDHGATIRYQYPMYIDPLTFVVYENIASVQPLTTYEYHAALIKLITERELLQRLGEVGATS